MARERDPIDLATRALRNRDRSRRELDDRLARAGIPEPARREALERLERVGYLDDRRFAAGRARALAQRGYGNEAIRHDLTGRGIEPETAETAVAELAPEAERAALLAARLGPDGRLAARLQRKGFDVETVASVLGAAFADTDEGA